MLNREKLGFVIIIIALLLFITNMGAINNFLSFHTDKTVQMEHSGVVVPDTWNTTAELGMGNKSKSPYSITNGYIILDIFENWPEDHVGPATLSKLSSMEGGNFEVMNQEKIKLGNYNIYLTKKCLHFRKDGDIIRSSKRYLYFFIFLPLFSLETPAVVWSTAAGVFTFGCESIEKRGEEKKNGKI